MVILKSLNKRIRICKNFGFKAAIAGVLQSNIRFPSFLSRILSRWHDKIVLDYLNLNFNYVIDKYKNFELDKSELKALTPAPIWVMWLQGEENMPEIVKACYKSIKANCAGHPVKLLTQENLKDYVKLPEHIWKRVESKQMTLTHFSNFCRMYLLYTYGGLWLDATIFVTSEIKREIFDLPFYTINYDFTLNHRNVNLGRWTAFLLAGKPGNIVCKAVLDLLIEYWRINDMLIDFSVVDYSIAEAYNMLPECRKLIDAVPRNNTEWRGLAKLLNTEFNQEIFNNLKLSTQFFKLTYKQQFNKLMNNHKTFYAHILEMYK